MSEDLEFSFQNLLDALLDLETPFNPRYLYRLSDLEGSELARFLQIWPRLPLWRRQALLEDIRELGSVDDLLSFESIGRNVIADEDSQIRLLAVQILWEFDERDLIAIYLDLLRSDPSAEVRAASAVGLGQFVYLGEIDRLPKERLEEIEDNLLYAYHHDPEVMVQCRALESIGYSSRPEIPSIVEIAFASDVLILKTSALIAMGRSMDSRWEATILSMMNSKMPALRAEAARAAGEIMIKDAIPALIDLTSDSEENVRAAAIWSLSEIGGERARHSLEKLFQEAVDDQEADFLESALDNIAFTDGMQPFSLFDFPEEDSDDELLEMLISQESSPEGNGDGSLDEQDLEMLDGNEQNNADKGIQV